MPVETLSASNQHARVTGPDFDGYTASLQSPRQTRLDKSELIKRRYGVSSESRHNKEIPPRGIVFDSGQNRMESHQNDDILSRDWLAGEVNHARLEPVASGDVPWYHLAGTGYWVREAVDQLLRNTRNVGKEAFPRVLELELDKAAVDLRAFNEEYIKQMASLRWDLAWGERNGERMIICPKYKGDGEDAEGTLLQAATSKKERGGAVYETLFGDTEKETTGVQGWLRTAPENSFAVITSPAGWSGLTDAAGKPIRYKETQVYVIKTLKGGRLQAYTFRSDANIIQNEAMQRELGLSVEETPDQIQRINNTFMNVALLTPEDAEKAEHDGRTPIRDFKDVTAVMQKALGGRLQAYDDQTFEDINAYLDNPALFNREHPLTEKLIKRVQDYARMRIYQGGLYSDVEKDLQIAFALTPIQMNQLYRDNKKVMSRSGMRTFNEAESVQILQNYALIPGGMDYRNEGAELKKLRGCAGGDGTVPVFSMGSWRRGETESESSGDYEFKEKGFCVECGKGPVPIGPCSLCIPCDAEKGGKGVELMKGSKEMLEELGIYEKN